MKPERRKQNETYRGAFLISLLLMFPACEGAFSPAYCSIKNYPCLPAKLIGRAQSDFSGLWQSDFGILDLKQSGSHVEGTYSCCGGKLSGTVKGNQIDFSWKDPIYGEGWGTFTLDATGEKLSGVWGRGTKNNRNAEGLWNAIRFREKKFDGMPTYWELAGSNAQAGDLRGKAVLYIAGSKVGGKLEGVYVREINNHPLRIEVFNYLQGIRQGTRYDLTWENPMDGSRGSMTLDGDNNRLQGQWRTPGGQSAGTIVFTKASGPISEGIDQINANRRIEEARSISEGDSHLMRASQLETQYDYRKAIEEYDKAARLYSMTRKKEKLASAYYGIGSCRLALGEYQVAREFFKRVLDIGPEAGETNRLLANTGIMQVNIKLGIPPR